MNKTFESEVDKKPAIALVCAATTSIVDPASRCSRVSPTQAITFKPCESAYPTLSATNCHYKHKWYWKKKIRMGGYLFLFENVDGYLFIKNQ